MSVLLSRPFQPARIPRLVSVRRAVFQPRFTVLTMSSQAGPEAVQNASSGRPTNEAEIKRNPHGDFKKVEGARPDWDASSSFHYTKTIEPSWAPGDGANHLHDDPHLTKKHVAIDPYEPGRPVIFNYKLLISAITPRPIAFVSTRSADGKTENLAPFSYFNMMSHDPPLLVVGFSSPAAHDKAKDTLRNLIDTKQCVVNIISEGFVEAANACAVNAPSDASEWPVSGLTPAYDCVDVPGVPRVKEAVFSVEAKLDSLKEYESKVTPGKMTCSLVVLEGTRFWVREDALNDEKNLVDPAVLRPMSRLGGITYGRTTEAMEILRMDFDKNLGGREAYDKLEKNGNGANGQ